MYNDYLYNHYLAENYLHYLDNIAGFQDFPMQCADASVKKNDANSVPGDQL